MRGEGGVAGLRGLSQAHGAQINFGDLTSYLTYSTMSSHKYAPPKMRQIRRMTLCGCLFSVSVAIFPELRVIPEVGQSANFPIQWAVWPESGPSITPPPPPPQLYERKNWHQHS